MCAVRVHVAADASLAGSAPEEQQRHLRYLDALEVVYAEPDPQVRQVTLAMSFANPGTELPELLTAARTATATS